MSQDLGTNELDSTDIIWSFFLTTYVQVKFKFPFVFVLIFSSQCLPKRQFDNIVVKVKV
jgi:hypothetical protein